MCLHGLTSLNKTAAAAGAPLKRRKTFLPLKVNLHGYSNACVIIKCHNKEKKFFKKFLIIIFKKI